MLIKKAIKIIQNEGWKVFSRKAIQYPFNRLRDSNLLLKLFKNQAIKKIQNLQSENQEEVFDFAWNFYFGVIRPSQIKEEFLELLKIFKEQNSKYILEIGTASGGTLFCFCKLAKNDATLISIDLPEGPFGGGYPEWKIPLYKSFARKNSKIHLIRADSHSLETLEKVKNILNGKKIDFLFIDGDHSYQGVKRDFEMYNLLVKKEGIIAFHDIIPGPIENVGGVPEFWKEIKNNFRIQEIVKDRQQGGCGIGIIIN